MKILITIFLLSISFFSVSQNTKRKLDNFTKIVAIGNFRVFIEQAEKPSVMILNKENNLKDSDIITEVQGTELVIRLKNDTYSTRNIDITVYTSEVFEITAKRGVTVDVKYEMTASKIDFNVNTGSSIYGTVNCKVLGLSIKNGGTIRLSGKANDATYYISKGGSIVAFNLVVEQLKTEVLFGGDANINVTNSLYAVVKGGGTIKYKGNPKKIKQNIKLGGKIKKID